jgi:hypothetical protein
LLIDKLASGFAGARSALLKVVQAIEIALEKDVARELVHSFVPGPLR